MADRIIANTDAGYFWAPGDHIESVNAGFEKPKSDSKITRNSLMLKGSSMAAPFVTATLATMKVLSPGLSLPQAKKILSQTAIVRGSREKTGDRTTECGAGGAASVAQVVEEPQ